MYALLHGVCGPQQGFVPWWCMCTLWDHFFFFFFLFTIHLHGKETSERRSSFFFLLSLFFLSFSFFITHPHPSSSSSYFSSSSSCCCSLFVSDVLLGLWTPPHRFKLLLLLLLLFLLLYLSLSLSLSQPCECCCVCVCVCCVVFVVVDKKKSLFSLASYSSFFKAVPMDDARHPSSSSSSSSGLLTPLVSPRPVLPSATDDNGWKVIGSPPRKLVLSPPDDRKGPSPKASPEDREPLSLSVPRQNTDIASKSNHAPIAALSHDPDLLLTPTTPSPQALAVYATSPSRLDLLPDPPALGSRRRSFGLLDINSNIHQQPYNVGLASNHGANLESPLSLSSFLWNGRVDENAANPAQSALGMTAAVRQDTVTGGSNIFSMSAALHAHPFVPSGGRTVRSLSLSEPLGFHAYTTGSNSSKPSVFGHGEGDGLELYRVQLPTMEEEPEDALEHPRVSRARSYSTSAAFSPGSFYGSLSSSTYSSTEPQSTFVSSSTISDSLNPLDNQDQHPFLNRKFSVGSTWPHISHHSTDGRSGISSTHRRSITSSTYVPPIWESPSSNLPSQQPAMDREQAERQRVSRRFSLAPSSGFQTYDHFLESEHYNASSLSGGNR